MKIQVTKTFCKFINDTAKEFNVKFSANFVKLNGRARELYCGDDSTWINSPDYDWDKQAFNTIRISYPADYCACDRYITTEELTKEFRRRGVKTIEHLKTMIVDMFEI